MAKMCVSLVFALLVTLHVSSNSVEASPYALNQEISIYNTYDKPVMPDACRTDYYCFEKGEDYPEKAIKTLLEDMKSLIVEPRETSLDDRSGGDDSECPSKETFQPIYYIIDENYDVRVVVQSDKKFKQIYTVRTCANEGAITKTNNLFMNEHPVETFKPECVTTNMDLEFFVLNDDMNKIEIAKARGGIPVCCKCQLNFNP